MKTVLFIKVRSMGDTVLLSTSIQAFKKVYPDARVDLLLDSRWAPLYATDPLVHTIAGIGPHDSLWKKVKVLIALRKERYDAVFCFHASTSTAWIAALSGAPIRVIHHHDLNRVDRLSTSAIPDLDRVKPILERDLDTLRAAGLDVENLPPRIVLDAAERQQAREVLLNFGSPAPFLAIGVGASRPTKVWRRFADVARWWVESYRGSVLLVGSAQERDSISEIGRALPSGASIPVVDWSLREVAAILAECRVFVGNDSGPKHLAAAVGVPTVTLFGPEHPLEWHPYSTKAHAKLFVPDLPCRTADNPGHIPWCGLRTCTIEGHRCMEEIRPDQVQEAVRSVLI